MRSFFSDVAVLLAGKGSLLGAPLLPVVVFAGEMARTLTVSLSSGGSVRQLL